MQAPETSLKTEKSSLAEIRQIWSTTSQSWLKAGFAVLPIFIITRIIFLVLTHFGGVLFTIPNNSSFALNAQEVLYSWYHWDAPRNLLVATQGYIEQSYAGFFPLYPMLLNLLAKLHVNLLLAALVLSNVCLLLALTVLYRLIEVETDTEIARRSILYLTVFPTALFLFNANNISLLLFFTVFCLYLLRRGYWWLAGCIGGLAALTDLFGVFLSIIFLYEFIRQHKESWREAKQRISTIFSLCGVLPILLGCGIYAYALARQFNDPFAFLHPQGTQVAVAPWTVIFKAINMAFRISPYTFAWTHSVFELLVLGLFIVLLILSCYGSNRLERHQWTFSIFGALVLLYALIFPNLPNAQINLYDPLPSLQTVVLLIVPGFILLARLGRREWFHYSYLLLALPMQAFLVLQLFTGRWML